jgi:hypothetical protein
MKSPHPPPSGRQKPLVQPRSLYRSTPRSAGIQVNILHSPVKPLREELQVGESVSAARPHRHPGRGLVADNGPRPPVVAEGHWKVTD